MLPDWPQTLGLKILLPWPPKVLGLQVWATMSSLKLFLISSSKAPPRVFFKVAGWNGLFENLTVICRGSQSGHSASTMLVMRKPAKGGFQDRSAYTWLSGNRQSSSPISSMLLWQYSTKLIQKQELRKTSQRSLEHFPESFIHGTRVPLAL